MAISFMEKPIDKETTLKVLNPLFKKWFFQKFKDLSLPQQYSFYTIHTRQNILVSAPTGSGKTLSAFGSILNELTDLEEKGKLENKIYAVYISPLKALSNDIQRNLTQPLEEMSELAGRPIHIRLGVRTGDTTAYQKSKMVKNPPHILITTPESLAIMLSTPSFRAHFSSVQWLVIDEIHSLAENKRGTHLSISMERLQYLSPGLTRIGLSATVAPIQEVAKFLVGQRDCQIVDVQFIKEYDFQVISPVDDLMNVSQKDLHDKLYTLIDDLIQAHRTTLIFTNTRAATERIVHHLKDRFPKHYTEEVDEGFEKRIGAHHGSLSKQHRQDLEKRLKEGKLKAVVCSTSLELGIDIGYVDLVICLGSPKSVARLLQRCLPYDARVLTSTGEYLKIGDIVEKRLKVKIISYDEKGNFIENEIHEYQKNLVTKVVDIELESLDEIKCTPNHPLLTRSGWKKAGELSVGDEVATLGREILFKKKKTCLYEVLSKEKFFVENKEQFFFGAIEKLLDVYENKKEVAKAIAMPYARLIDCTRISGRKKSIRLDYFLNACELAGIKRDEFISHLRYLKSQSNYRKEVPLQLTEEIMWLAGIVASDGCIVRTKTERGEYYHIKIGNTSSELILKSRKIMQKLGFECHEYFRKDGFITIECGSLLLADIFMNLGIPCKNKTREVRVDEIIYKLPEELQYAYLEGVFEGEGNFSQKMIRIFSASKEFVIGLRTLLVRLGYNARINIGESKVSAQIKKINHKEIYCLVIGQQSEVKRFLSKIPCYGRKATYSRRLSLEFNDKTLKRKDHEKGVVWYKIKSMKEDEKEQTYNLTLKNPHNNFLVGNIITHNSGRAGHALHKTTKARIIVSDRDDLVECSVMLKSALEKKIDRIHIPINALDVLSQHIVGMATEQAWEEKELFNLITQSYCYQSLKPTDFEEVLKYLSGSYVSLEDRHVYAKIWRNQGKLGVKGMMTRVIYMTNIGTIPDETNVKVKLGEAVIGTVDESFLERLKPGDIFVLGGDIYEFKFSRGTTAQVSACGSRPPTVPSWFSEQLPLSFDLAMEIGRFRRLMQEQFEAQMHRADILTFIHQHLFVDEKAAQAIFRYMKEQYEFCKIIPSDKVILVEHYHHEHERKIIFHTLYGRRVNDCLSRSIAFALAATQKRDVEVGINDGGFYIAYNKPVSPIAAFEQLTTENLPKVLSHAIDKSEVFKRRFRHCAARALMILRNYKGHERKVGRQQMSSMILMKALKDIDPNFSILREAKREVMEDLMDIDNALFIIEKFQEKKIQIKEIHTKIPSPFAFNLVLQGHLDILKMEDKLEFLKRMHSMVLAKIARGSSKDLLGDSEKIMQEKGSVETQMMKKYHAEQQELNAVQHRLIEKVQKLRRIPHSSRQEIVQLIKGKSIADANPDFIQRTKENQEEILREWPTEVADFVLTIFKEREKFNIQDYCKKVEADPLTPERLKKDRLIDDIKRIARREKLEDERRYELMAAVEGKELSKETKAWAKELIKGTIPKYVSDDVFKFLKERT